MRKWLLLLLVLISGLGAFLYASFAGKARPGHDEVREIRARYRPKLDELTLRWRRATPEGKLAVEREAQPVWREYRGEVLGAHERWGLKAPEMPEDWSGAPLALPWEETPGPN